MRRPQHSLAMAMAISWDLACFQSLILINSHSSKISILRNPLSCRSVWFWIWLGLSLFGIFFVLPLSCCFCTCCFWAKRRRHQRGLIFSTPGQPSKDTWSCVFVASSNLSPSFSHSLCDHPILAIRGCIYFIS